MPLSWSSETKSAPKVSLEKTSPEVPNIYLTLVIRLVPELYGQKLNIAMFDLKASDPGV
jgi:hypothetical protein